MSEVNRHHYTTATLFFFFLVSCHVIGGSAGQASVRSLRTRTAAFYNLYLVPGNIL